MNRLAYHEKEKAVNLAAAAGKRFASRLRGTSSRLRDVRKSAKEAAREIEKRVAALVNVKSAAARAAVETDLERLREEQSRLDNERRDLDRARDALESVTKNGPNFAQVLIERIQGLREGLKKAGRDCSRTGRDSMRGVFSLILGENSLKMCLLPLIESGAGAPFSAKLPSYDDCRTVIEDLALELRMYFALESAG